jgi:hypothetical protein
MSTAISIIDRVSALRQFMAQRAADAPPTIDRIQTVFLIGSCSDELVDDWYQDYDIHFLFDGLALRPETLHWLRDLLAECRQMSDASCRIETFVRDRHWKMVPDRAYESNIGIHATLLNSADHYRRLHYNSLLAFNMYKRCYVVYGCHPAEIRGWRPPQLADYACSVGGIGWMSENFARAVMLRMVLPDDRSFYPFIAGYCWNVASTLMFHLYTLEQGNVTGRRQAYEYFVKRTGSDAADREAADLLMHEKENPSADAATARRLINAAGRVLHTIRKRVWELLPPEVREVSVKSPGILGRAPLYRQWPQGEPPEVIDVVRREDPDDYYGTAKEALAAAQRETNELLSSKENFEFLRDLMAGGKRLTKVRIWDSASLPRKFLSHDFHLDRSVPSADAIFFGWEDGIQAFLQRLHEVYIAKGEEDAELRDLARLSYEIVANRVSSYFGVHVQGGETQGLWETTRELSRILRPFLPIQTR